MIYLALATVLRLWHAFGGYRVSRVGSERLPRAGGVVLAINHTSYVDFTFAGLEMLRTDRRRVRFMGKKELQDNPVLRFLMWGCGVIPVDRSAGHDAYVAAVEQLQRGEVVAIYPESTISLSLEIETLKSGAARMALEAGVPIVPCIVWGTQRIAPKGAPKNLGRSRLPVAVATGDPIMPTGSVDELTALLRDAMATLLDEVQAAYGTHPAGAAWVPERLGGSAPPALSPRPEPGSGPTSDDG